MVFWKKASVLLRTDPQITGDTELGKRVAIIDSFTYPENVRDIVTSLAKDGYEPVAFLSLCCLNEKVEEELEKSRKEAGLGSIRYYPPSETIPDPFGILTNLPFD